MKTRLSIAGRSILLGSLLALLGGCQRPAAVAEQDAYWTVEQFKTAAKPLAAKHWGGKLPEFSILIDAGAKTRASYSVRGMPLLLLVDPEGHLVNVQTQPVLTYLEARLRGEPRPKGTAEEADSDG